MDFGLLLNGTVIAAVIGAGATIGTVLIKRHHTKRDKKAELVDETTRRKNEAYKNLRITLFKLSDRDSPVTIKKIREIYPTIKYWMFEEGSSEAYENVRQEHTDLHHALEDFSMSRRPDNEIISKEDWQKIKQLRNALIKKAGGSEIS